MRRNELDRGSIDNNVEQLVSIWRSLLRDDSLGAHSDFFDGGGTSLTAVRLRSRIRAQLGRDIDLLDVFDHPTPAELATALQTARPWRAGTER
jgi:hypothetical protein